MANDVSTLSAKAKKLCYASPKTSKLVPGRRSFLEYRDLGVGEATGGWMRAQVAGTKQGMTEPTGWHYHVCDGQFVYVLKGSVDLEFEDGTELHCKAGDSVFIPGGLRHNEMRTSTDFQYLEVSVPAAMGTVPVDPPKKKR